MICERSPKGRKGKDGDGKRGKELAGVGRGTRRSRRKRMEGVGDR